jgi:hypothetical protein
MGQQYKEENGIGFQGRYIRPARKPIKLKTSQLKQYKFFS